MKITFASPSKNAVEKKKKEKKVMAIAKLFALHARTPKTAIAERFVLHVNAKKVCVKT